MEQTVGAIERERSMKITLRALGKKVALVASAFVLAVSGLVAMPDVTGQVAHAATAPQPPSYHSPADGKVLTELPGGVAKKAGQVHLNLQGISNHRYEIRYASSLEALESTSWVLTGGGGQYTFINVELPNGTYYWQARTRHKDDKLNWSAPTTPRSFTVALPDTTAPFVSLTSPGNGDVLDVSSVDIRGTVQDDNPHHYWLNVKRDGVTIHNAIVNHSDSFVDEVLYTVSGDGHYAVTLAARDAMGGTNTSGNRSDDVILEFTIATTPPDPEDGDDDDDNTGGSGNTDNDNQNPGDGGQQPQINTPQQPAVNLGTPVPAPVVVAFADTVSTVLGTQTEAAQAQPPRTTTAGDDTKDGEVLAAQDVRDSKSWSLVNVLLSILTVILGIVALFGRGTARRIVALVAAVAAVVVALLVEDFAAPMGWINLWTILFAAIAAVQVGIVAAGKKPTEEE